MCKEMKKKNLILFSILVVISMVLPINIKALEFPLQYTGQEMPATEENYTNLVKESDMKSNGFYGEITFDLEIDITYNLVKKYKLYKPGAITTLTAGEIKTEPQSVFYTKTETDLEEGGSFACTVANDEYTSNQLTKLGGTLMQMNVVTSGCSDIDEKLYYGNLAIIKALGGTVESVDHDCYKALLNEAEAVAKLEALPELSNIMKDATDHNVNYKGKIETYKAVELEIPYSKYQANADADPENIWKMDIKAKYGSKSEFDYLSGQRATNGNLHKLYIIDEKGNDWNADYTFTKAGKTIGLYGYISRIEAEAFDKDGSYNPEYTDYQVGICDPSSKSAQCQENMKLYKEQTGKEFTALPDGTYTIIAVIGGQTKHPKSNVYSCNSNDTTGQFVTSKYYRDIDNDYAVFTGTIETTYNKNNGIQIEQTGEVQIYNKDAKGNLITGSEFELQDESGKVLFGWNTNDKNPYVYKKPLVGKYYVVQKSVAEGYSLNKNKIEFEVKTVDEKIVINFTNEAVVKVPDTLSNVSIILIAVALVGLLIGAWLIYKNYKERVEF